MQLLTTIISNKEVMTKIFQATIVLLALTYTAFFFMPYIWQYMYSDETIFFLGIAGTESSVDLSGPLLYLLSAFYLISYIGLYNFHPIGRLLFTALVIFNLAISPFTLGYSATAYLDTSIGYLLSLLEGGVLVMVYLTEISKRFNKHT